MNLQEAISIFNIFGWFWVILILVTYGLAIFWNARFLLLTKTQTYSWIKWYAVATCSVVILAYGYVMINSIFTHSSNPDFFAVMVIRPILILIGGVLASSARARLTSLKQGGERWISHK